MNIITIDINKLKDSEYNPRITLKPGDEEYDAIKNSIESFGYIQPLIINKDYEIISGHQRKNILLDLGRKKVDCVLVNLSKKKEKSLNIAMNKITGKWDDEKLFDILKDIKVDEAEFTLTGFNQNEFDDLFKTFDEEGYSYSKSGLGSHGKEVEEDNFDVDETVKTNIKLGDLFELGQHYLMCGDCTDKETIEYMMSNFDKFLVFTDPPYGINIVKKNGKVGEGIITKVNTYENVIGDDSTQTAKNFYNLFKELGFNKFIIWDGNYFLDFLDSSEHFIVWDKKKGTNRNDFADGEIAYTNLKTPVRIFPHLWNGMIQEGEREKRIHPTQKPVKLIADIIKYFNNNKYKWDVICDCFAGSGSTLIACEQLEIKSFNMELSENYCQIIIDRWETFTGKRAKKIN